jgi:hypothetical protein
MIFLWPVEETKDQCDSNTKRKVLAIVIGFQTMNSTIKLKSGVFTLTLLRFLGVNGLSFTSAFKWFKDSICSLERNLTELKRRISFWQKEKKRVN